MTLDEAYAATMVSTLDSPPTPRVQLSNITPAMIDNMFIVSPPPEVAEAINEELQDDANKDQGLLDFDFLEFIIVAIAPVHNGFRIDFNLKYCAFCTSLKT